MENKEIFVFGSNLSGIHGAGAAKCAFEEHGAKWREGIGHHGNSYAIPTKDKRIKTLPLRTIQLYVREFLNYAHAHPEFTFNVTRIGCGLAGYKDEDIAPLFRGYTSNCRLDSNWERIIKDMDKSNVVEVSPGT